MDCGLSYHSIRDWLATIHKTPRHMPSNTSGVRRRWRTPPIGAPIGPNRKLTAWLSVIAAPWTSATCCCPGTLPVRTALPSRPASRRTRDLGGPFFSLDIFTFEPWSRSLFFSAKGTNLGFSYPTACVQGHTRQCWTKSRVTKPSDMLPADEAMKAKPLHSLYYKFWLVSNLSVLRISFPSTLVTFGVQARLVVVYYRSVY
jgi:hypothetical protein